MLSFSQCIQVHTNYVHIARTLPLAPIHHSQCLTLGNIRQFLHYIAASEISILMEFKYAQTKHQALMQLS